MDRPTNLMVVNSVMLFDEPVYLAQLSEVYGTALVARYPRFSQRVVESALPLRAPSWVDDPDFDLDHHLHHLGLPAPGDTAALQAVVGDLIDDAAGSQRPLWHAYLIDGLRAGAAISAGCITASPTGSRSQA